MPADYKLGDFDGPVEVEYPYPYSKAVLGLERAPLEDEVVCTYLVPNGVKKAVIERDTDILTKDEERIHKEEIAAAILKELKTWQHYQCFSRRPRSESKNIIDSRWVLKWKWVADDTGKSRRVIRARLCVRGFKDIDAGNLVSARQMLRKHFFRV